MKDELINKIDDYLNGKLSEDNKVAFEAELKSNENLRKQVAFMRALPNAIKANAENKIIQKLKEFESSAEPIEELLVEEDVEIYAYREPALGSKRAIYPSKKYDPESPKETSIVPWWKYAAVAASILLIVGVSFLINWTNNENRLQLAKETERLQDSIKSVEQLKRFAETPIASMSLPVTEIGEPEFGFAHLSISDSLTIIVVSAVEPTVEVYGKFKNDTIYFRATCRRRFSVFRVNKNNHLAIPDAEGIYLMETSKLIYRIADSDTFARLSPVSPNLNLELLQHQIKKQKDQ